MPPPGEHSPRQKRNSIAPPTAFFATSVLDHHAKPSLPSSGESAALRRMTRNGVPEFHVEILLGIDVDILRVYLPPDPSSDGFDNITVDTLSPLLLERYLTAAQRVSRAAVGTVPELATRWYHHPCSRPISPKKTMFEGLPFGTRGGTVIGHHFMSMTASTSSKYD